MKNPSTLLFCILVLIIASANTIAQGSKMTKSGAVLIPLNWYEIYKDTTLRSTFFKAEKIDKNKLVFLKVTNFNFLRYNLDHEVQEEVVKSYRVPENLWDQVFSYIPVPLPGPKAAIDTAKNEFLLSLKNWRQKLARREKSLQDYLEKFPNNVHVTDDEKAKLKEKIEDTSNGKEAIGVGALKDLEKIRQKTEELIFSSANIAVTVFDTLTVVEPKENYIMAQIRPFWSKTTSENTATDAYYASILYDKQLLIHEKVVQKFKAFFAAGRKTYRGTRINIGKKESGTLVTITMTPVGLSNENIEIANKTRPVSVQYFVQSDKPVVFHVGYSLAFLEDTEFEKVRTLAGNDGFTLIQGECYSLELSAFLSYELLKSNDEKQSLGITLGTDMTSPGDKIYIGISGRLFEHWFFTIGAVTGEIVEGVNEQIGNPEIKLFESIKTTRDWGFVLGISLSPF
jgi:hypothetical protein